MAMSRQERFKKLYDLKMTKGYKRSNIWISPEAQDILKNQNGVLSDKINSAILKTSDSDQTGISIDDVLLFIKNNFLNKKGNVLNTVDDKPIAYSYSQIETKLKEYFK